MISPFLLIKFLIIIKSRIPRKTNIRAFTMFIPTRRLRRLLWFCIVFLLMTALYLVDDIKTIIALPKKKMIARFVLN